MHQILIIYHKILRTKLNKYIKELDAVEKEKQSLYFSYHIHIGKVMDGHFYDYLILCSNIN